MRALLCVLLILSFAAQAADGIKFADDFESYSVGTLPTTNWLKEGDHDMVSVVTTAVDGGSPRSGTKQVQAQWAGATYTSFAKNIDSLYTCAFLLENYWRFDADYENTGASSQAHWNRFRIESPYQDYLYSVQSNATAFLMDIFFNGNKIGEKYYSQPSSAAFHRVRLYANVCTGVIKAWHDNDLGVNASGVSVGSQRFTTYYNVSNWSSAQPTISHIYFDDFKLYTDTGNASGCTGTMAGGDIQCAGAETPTYMPIRSSNDENWDANDYRLAA